MKKDSMSNQEVVIGSDQPDRGEQDEAAVRDSKLTTEPVAPTTYGPKNVPATMNSTVLSCKKDKDDKVIMNTPDINDGSAIAQGTSSARQLPKPRPHFCSGSTTPNMASGEHEQKSFLPLKSSVDQSKDDQIGVDSQLPLQGNGLPLPLAGQKADDGTALLKSQNPRRSSHVSQNSGAVDHSGEAQFQQPDQRDMSNHLRQLQKPTVVDGNVGTSANAADKEQLGRLTRSNNSYSRHSNHSRSNMSLSLQRFQQSIPKKEYKNDLTADVNENDTRLLIQNQAVGFQNQLSSLNNVGGSGAVAGMEQCQVPKVKKTKNPAPPNIGTFSRESGAESTFKSQSSMKASLAVAQHAPSESSGHEQSLKTQNRWQNNMQTMLQSLKMQSFNMLLAEAEKLSDPSELESLAVNGGAVANPAQKSQQRSYSNDQNDNSVSVGLTPTSPLNEIALRNLMSKYNLIQQKQPAGGSVQTPQVTASMFKRPATIQMLQNQRRMSHNDFQAGDSNDLQEKLLYLQQQMLASQNQAGSSRQASAMNTPQMSKSNLNKVTDGNDQQAAFKQATQLSKQSMNSLITAHFNHPVDAHAASSSIAQESVASRCADTKSVMNGQHGYNFTLQNPVTRQLDLNSEQKRPSLLKKDYSFSNAMDQQQLQPDAKINSPDKKVSGAIGPVAAAVANNSVWQATSQHQNSVILNKIQSSAANQSKQQLMWQQDTRQNQARMSHPQHASSHSINKDHMSNDQDMRQASPDVKKAQKQQLIVDETAANLNMSSGPQHVDNIASHQTNQPNQTQSSIRNLVMTAGMRGDESQQVDKNGKAPDQELSNNEQPASATSKVYELLQGYLNRQSQGENQIAHKVNQLHNLLQSNQANNKVDNKGQALHQQTGIQTELSAAQSNSENNNPAAPWQSLLTSDQFSLLQNLMSLRHDNEARSQAINQQVEKQVMDQVKNGAVTETANHLPPQQNSSSLSGNLAEGSRNTNTSNGELASKGLATGSGSRESNKEVNSSEVQNKEQNGPGSGERTSGDDGKAQAVQKSNGQTSGGNTGTDKDDPSSGLDLNNLRNLMENYKPPLQSQQLSQIQRELMNQQSAAENATQDQTRPISGKDNQNQNQFKLANSMPLDSATQPKNHDDLGKQLSDPLNNSLTALQSFLQQAAAGSTTALSNAAGGTSINMDNTKNHASMISVMPQQSNQSQQGKPLVPTGAFSFGQMSDLAGRTGVTATHGPLPQSQEPKPMRYNGPTSSSDCDENGRGTGSNAVLANTLTASNGEDKKPENKSGIVSGDSIGVSSGQANASSSSEGHVALVKHIKWQEQELLRLKTLLILQGIQHMSTQAGESAQQTNQSGQTVQSTKLTNQLMSGGLLSAATMPQNGNQSNQQLNSISGMGLKSNLLDRRQQQNGDDTQQAVEELQATGGLTPATLNYLRMAGIQVPSSLSVQTGNQGMAVKRGFGDMSNAINESANQNNQFVKPTDILMGNQRFMSHADHQEPNSALSRHLANLQRLNLPMNTQRELVAGSSIDNHMAYEPDSLAKSRAMLANLTAGLSSSSQHHGESANMSRSLKPNLDQSARCAASSQQISSSIHMDSKVSGEDLQSESGASDEDKSQNQLLKIKDQLHANLDQESYENFNLEILSCVRQQKVRGRMDDIVLEEKPKRLHARVGGSNFRGSQYRGVSKNKFKWQMMIMINQKKVYLGAIKTETIAARFYDYIAIISQGLNAKTNFSYTANDLLRIVRLFDKNTDLRVGEFGFDAKTGGLISRSNMSSAMPDREAHQSFKRQRLDSVDSSQSNNHKEDLILASQLYRKENPLATQSSIVATDQGLNGSGHQSYQDNQLLQSLLLLQNLRNSQQQQVLQNSTASLVNSTQQLNNSIAPETSHISQQQQLMQNEHQARSKFILNAAAQQQHQPEPLQESQTINSMSWNMLYNYAANMAKDQQALKQNGNAAQNGKSNGPVAANMSYKTPIRKRDSSDYDA